MIRSLLSLLLAMACTAGASAQTTPASPKKGTRTNATMRRPASPAKPAPTSSMADAPVSTKGQTQSIYAAPGEPIQVPEGKVGPYDGPAAKRKTTQSGTTLSPR